MKTFICTRYYAIEAETEEEAKEIMRDIENDLDFLKEEEWEEAPEIKWLKHIMYLLITMTIWINTATTTWWDSGTMRTFGW